ncbi:hypothetical protein PIROE2DRAFT_4139 [Piromyces sp. E2]|nr:hypothetical protein PIROE2DRAFT_4139 [Piromyces sp. E2]|eukprot:OUM68256.1 hypothetical protein PIROE2DRAFT_4139 [Piromyces sp. E2]
MKCLFEIKGRSEGYETCSKFVIAVSFGCTSQILSLICTLVEIQVPRRIKENKK